MAARTASKPARTATKPTVKTPGKDQIKNDKQAASLIEIIPGKFNELDWLAIIENDETEDFVADILDNIWTDVSEQIQQIYIRRQLLPFTLMMTENALSNVIQWAFLEKDEPRPASGDFWREDEEPTPCSMDNWGEGVVPACREENPRSSEESPVSPTDEPIAAPLVKQTSEDVSQQFSRSSSDTSSIHPISKCTQPPDIDPFQYQSNNNDANDQSSSENESSAKKISCRLSFENMPYNHDILVIENQPPKLEPLSDLFYTLNIPANSLLSDSARTNSKKKHRRIIAPKASSQIGSEAFISVTNVTATTTTKSTRKVESKLFADQHIEDVIAKAPAAAHSMLKSILNRPPGYRELELDDNGNVVSMAKIDPDRFQPRSVQVKCDIVQPRKAVGETRTLPKPIQQMKTARSSPKFNSVKIVHPDQSTDVGDLIQPVPGVLYEDSKLKKGDPRRYKNGMSLYANFYDDTRSLRPIARRTDFAVMQIANELLFKSKDFIGNKDNDKDSDVPKLHRFARIPPIMSASSASSA